MSSLMGLPLEIHINIIGYMDFPTLVDFTSTNHYFHKLDLKRQKRAALLDLEQRAPGTPKPDAFTQLLIRHTHLPCYSCLRFLNPVTYFDPEQTLGARALGQHQASRRRCARCESRKGLSRAKWGASALVFRNGYTYIECLNCREVKRYVINDLHEQAWARGQSCMECWWFKKVVSNTPQIDTDPVATDADWVAYDSKRLVRVPVMDGKTAAMLFGEISLRTPKQKPSEFKQAAVSIKAAVKLPNVRVSKVEADTEPHQRSQPPAYLIAASGTVLFITPGAVVHHQMPNSIQNATYAIV